MQRQQRTERTPVPRNERRPPITLAPTKDDSMRISTDASITIVKA